MKYLERLKNTATTVVPFLQSNKPYTVFFFQIEISGIRGENPYLM